MLAELAAANAAFAVIKEAIGNGGDLVAAGAKLGEYFGLKSEISKKANSKGSDSEEFWALEKLRKQEEQLKEMMIYQGRAGLWEDWLKFQAQKKKEREEEARRQRIKVARRKELLYDVFVSILIAIIGFSGIGIIGLMVWYILTKGQ
jgi:hypothetical protein